MDTLEYTYGHDIVAQELGNLVIFVRYNNGIGFAVIKPGLKHLDQLSIYQEAISGYL